MSSEWRTGYIGEFVDLSQGLAINAKSKHLLVKKGLPLLRITDLINNAKVQFINEALAPVKCIAKRDEVIFTRTGQVGLVFKNKTGVVHNNCFKVLPKDKSVNFNFLYWFLKQRKIYEYVNSIASGSVQKDLNHSAFRTIPFNLPPPPEQKAIAHILGTLDDKIELNRKMNETLEAMAQALFKSWFVDFDPVIDNALAAGHDIPEDLQAKAARRKAVKASGQYKSLPKVIQQLFPAAFEYNEELGKWIPEGWENKSISNIAEVVGGGTPSTKVEEYFCKPEIGIPWLSPKDLSGYKWRYISNGAKSITKLGLVKSSAKLMPKGTVVFSSRAPIGYIAISENELSTNQGFKSLVPSKGVPNEYLYQLLKANQEEIESIATGSTFKEVSGSALKGFQVIVPHKELLSAFQNHSERNNLKLLTIQHQNENLIRQRDLLLSQLISGKTRLPKSFIKQFENKTAVAS